MGARLDAYTGVQDLKGMNDEQLVEFCREVRWTLITRCAVAGGHLATNLGVVELTVGMYASWVDPWSDAVIFDGQHAGYVHKLLTDRKELFTNIDRMRDMAFNQTTTLESSTDVLNAAHVGFGVSTLVGIAMAGRRSVAVIGDALLGNGVALQAINHAATVNNPPLIVVNDNRWSIDRMVGGVHEHGGVDELLGAMGYTVLNVDGHDVAGVRAVFNQALGTDGPVAIHAHTEKGHGFAPAERDPLKYHYVLAGGFAVAVNPVKHLMSNVRDVASEHLPMDALLAKLMTADPAIVAITAAMADVGLGDLVRATGRLVDVGIAEEHAVCLATGLALSGHRPVIACCATYMQRMVDAFLNVAVVNGPLSIVVVVHEAGVNDDGPFQQGVHAFTCANMVPGAEQRLPRTRVELHRMLTEALTGDHGLVFIHVPHEFELTGDLPGSTDWTRVTTGDHRVVVVPFGNAWALGAAAAEQLGASLVSAPMVGDGHWTSAVKAVADHQLVVTIEEGLVECGLGQRLAARLPGQCVVNLGVGQLELVNFDRARQLPLCGLTVDAVVKRVRRMMGGDLDEVDELDRLSNDGARA